jgi:hypothetical protein
VACASQFGSEQASNKDKAIQQIDAERAAHRPFSPSTGRTPAVEFRQLENTANIG